MTTALAAATTTIAPPPALGYEVAITRKIRARNISIVRVFQNFDEDDDGKISKDDFKSAVFNQCGVALSDEQVEHVFKRSAYFAPPQMKDKVQDKMSFPEFSKYVDVTANSRVASSHPMDMGSSPAIVSRKVPGADKISQEGKARRVKAITARKIQQSLPVGREVTFAILNIDVKRESHIYGKEFDHWLRKLGISFSDEEMNLVRGDWKKEKGLTLQEFNFFINCLKNDCAKNDANAAMFEKLAEDRESSKEESQYGDHKTDDDLISSLLAYFEKKEKTLMGGFDLLNVTNSKTLSAQDIMAGLKKAGLIVGIQRAKLLIDKYVDISGRLSRPNFMRLMTSVSK